MYLQTSKALAENWKLWSYISLEKLTRSRRRRRFPHQYVRQATLRRYWRQYRRCLEIKKKKNENNNNKENTTQIF